ncbi:ATP-binding cassette domain-containing protein [Aquimarina sp. AD10]|uniref:sulfate/molybdate ABC transporter ATP-binding protein n=1 Tax=Aquimarina sp. AD10 TaxID=1714849 RepID=UPI000E5414F7|nr:ATP-binding cassette domain-containing protein [Aquimarina sp. AD10]AXT61621.1 ATP-binding cassette domain-containing protein [Aquimarina sp. AD10]RKN01030.1 ATP-binding cassette domain-containing protein [Aquimarina sp. AD10]
MIQLLLHKKLHTAKGMMPLDIDLAITPGEFVTLYGASGAGKTSTLRMISGLLTPDNGKLVVNDVVWLDTSKKTNLKPQQRKLGFVFQDYALFPNMSVLKNLEYALEKHQDNSIITELIDMMELGELQHQKPSTLSGGQQQRVALARALVQQPEILLLDEPLSALDTKMRIKLQDYILKVHQKYKLTTILVSHNIGEIIKLSDRVCLLEQGKIIKSGIPSTIFATHQMSAKFQFTGEVISIQKEEVVFIVTVLIGTNVVKVIAQESEIANLTTGDTVIVASKAFNPVIQKVL